MGFIRKARIYAEDKVLRKQLRVSGSRQRNTGLITFGSEGDKACSNIIQLTLEENPTLSPWLRSYSLSFLTLEVIYKLFVHRLMPRPCVIRPGNTPLLPTELLLSEQMMPILIQGYAKRVKPASENGLAAEVEALNDLIADIINASGDLSELVEP